MKANTSWITLSMLYVMVGCQTEPNRVLQNTPEAELVVAEKIISVEQRALQNKIAARALLQEIIDNKQNVEKEEIKFACSRNTGGVLTKIKSNEELIGVRFGQTLKENTVLTRLYFRKNDLNLIVYEKDGWQNQVYMIEQTIFYLENDQVFHCLYKSVRGMDNLENRIERTDYLVIDTNKKLLNTILAQAKEWREGINEENIAAYHCQ